MKGLTNNQLKVLALIFMTVDHVGMILSPWSSWMRVVGRLAFPIFAFLIAEGCRHTRSMGKYLGCMALLALGCQLVDYFQRGSLYQSILVTCSWQEKSALFCGSAWVCWAFSGRISFVKSCLGFCRIRISMWITALWAYWCRWRCIWAETSCKSCFC